MMLRAERAERSMWYRHAAGPWWFAVDGTIDKRLDEPVVSAQRVLRGLRGGTAQVSAELDG
eukprot:3488942-Rhodomonas_salina.3